MMEKQPSNNSILDQFINSQEQTYEEFLSTFSYLSKEELEMKSQVSQMESIENTFSLVELSNRNKQNVPPVRNKESSVSLSSQSLDEDQIMIGEGWKVGYFNQGDLSLTRRVKVDNYLELEDFDTDDEFGQETCSAGSLVLPGEVEETATCYRPSFNQPTNLEFGTLSDAQSSNSKTQEPCGDEVQLFSLDKEFDYDSVALTPKFSEAEMKAIMNSSEQKKEWIGLKSTGSEEGS